MKFQTTLLFILLMFFTVDAQRVKNPPAMTGPAVFRPSAGGLNLLDMNRVQMHHSYSFGVSSFGGGNTFSEGLYTNTLIYSFQAPVVMRMDVGVAHDPFGTQTFGPQQKSAQIYLQNLSLQYRPAENMLLTFAFSQYPGSSSMFNNPYRSTGMFESMDPWNRYYGYWR